MSKVLVVMNGDRVLQVREGITYHDLTTYIFSRTEEVERNDGEEFLVKATYYFGAQCISNVFPMDEFNMAQMLMDGWQLEIPTRDRTISLTYVIKETSSLV